MAENEIEIILTAIDNASKTIDNVNDSLGGTGGSGGLSGVSHKAAESVDELTASFEGMNLEQLSYISTLGMSKQKQDEYNRALDAATSASKKSREAINANKLSLYGLEVTMSTAIIAATALATAVEGAAISMYLLKQAGEYTNEVLKNTTEHSQNIVEISTKYQTLATSMSKIDIWGNINNNLALWTATTITLVSDKIAYLLSLLNLPTKGAQGYEFIQGGYNATQEASGGFAGGDFGQRFQEQSKVYVAAVEKVNNANYSMGKSFAFSYEDITTRITEKENEIATALGQGWGENSSRVKGLRDELGNLNNQLEDTKNKFILDMYAMKLAADGIAGDEALQKYLDMAVSLGLITEETHNATLAMLGLKNAADSIPSEVTTNVRVITTRTEEYEAGKPRVNLKRASGGFVQKGGWAIVGDAPSGHTTPYTETIHALPGGGVQVFNQSQKSIPAMAGGGMLMPSQNEVTLSFRTIQDLADALAYKMAQVQ